MEEEQGGDFLFLMEDNSILNCGIRKPGLFSFNVLHQQDITCLAD